MKLLITSIFCLLGGLLFAQAKSYSTVKIANWTLEKFPKHFLVKASKVYSEKNKLSGKVSYYQELNQYGQSEGLTVIMQKDYSSPHTVYYFRNGTVVYRALFFSNSTKAYEIVNKNINDEKDGPQLKREFLSNSKLKEVIDTYQDGRLLSMNKDNNAPVFVWKEGLLNGKFKFRNDYSSLDYEGIAQNGEIVYLKETYLNTDIIETKIVGDTIYINGIGGKENGKRQKYKVNTKIKITNDENLGDESGYFYCEYSSDIPKAINRMKLFSFPDSERYIYYKDNLLEGDFKYTTLKGGFYETYFGVAKAGNIEVLGITKIDFNENTGDSKFILTTGYNITSDSVFVVKKGSQKSEFELEDSYRIENTFKITNLDSLTKVKGFYLLENASLATLIYYMRKSE